MTTATDDIIRDAYRAAVAAADPDSGTTLREVVETVKVDLAARIREGSLELDPDDYLPMLIRRVDERDGAMADAVLERHVFGQSALDDDEATLDVVVTLGAGKRKLWRHVTADDLLAMDEIRYSNVRAAQDAYDRWRSTYSLARRAMAQYPTMGDAVTAGAFDALFRLVVA